MGDKSFLIKIGKRIRSFRVSKNISQETLAEFTDLHPTHIGKIERGEVKTTITTLRKIVKALDITLSEMFELKIKKEESEEKDLILSKIFSLLRKQDIKSLKYIEEILVKIIAFGRK